MDNDGNLEVSLWVRGHGTGGYGYLTLYELEENRLIERPLPPLSDEQRSGYGGHDQFTTSPSNIIHTFLVYKTGDANCCPIGGIVEAVYKYDGNQVILESFQRKGK